MHATEDVVEDEHIVEIPLDCLMTVEMGKVHAHTIIVFVFFTERELSTLSHLFNIYRLLM